MDWSKLFEVSSSVGKKAAGWSVTEEGKRFLFGTYTDGTPRSLVDSWNDEIMSPSSRESRMREIEKRREERDKMMRNTSKKKSKKKKKGKKKNKKRKNDIDTFWMSTF